MSHFGCMFILLFIVNGVGISHAIVARTNYSTKSQTPSLSVSPNVKVAIPKTGVKPSVLPSVSVVPGPVSAGIEASPSKQPEHSVMVKTTTSVIPSPSQSVGVSRSGSASPFATSKPRKKKLVPENISVRHERRPRRKQAVVRMLSLNPATLFLNGSVVAQISGAGVEVNVQRMLREGDVIGVHAVAEEAEEQYGVALSVRLGKRWVTLTPALVRAVRESHVTNDELWHMPRYDACKWPHAQSVSVAHPYESMNTCMKDTSAQYLWASADSTITPGDIFLRVVVGGDKCNKKHKCDASSSCDKRDGNDKSSKKRDNRDDRFTEDYPKEIGEGTTGRHRCKCRQSTSQNNGDCYYFTDSVSYVKGAWTRTCKRRNCFPEYECVENGVNHTNWCMWKYATHKVQPLQKWYANGYLCEQIKLNPVRVFLVPFA